MSDRVIRPWAGEEEQGEASPDRAVLDRMLKSRTIIASKPVDDKLARDVIAQLLMLEGEDPDRPITVIINSPGGSADSGFAMLDAINFVKPDVRTITMGMCASAAVMIHLGAEKKNRFVTANSRFLLHQPSMRSMGQASDLEIVSREIDRIRERYNRIVSEQCGVALDKVNEDVNRDFWLTAEEAVEYGLADRVITSRNEIE